MSLCTCILLCVLERGSLVLFLLSNLFFQVALSGVGGGGGDGAAGSAVGGVSGGGGEGGGAGPGWKHHSVEMRVTMVLPQYAAAAAQNVSPDSGQYWEWVLAGVEFIRRLRGENRVCMAMEVNNYLGAMINNTTRQWKPWNERWAALWPRNPTEPWIYPNVSDRTAAAADGKEE